MAGLLERACPGADLRTGARGRRPHQCEELCRHRMRLGTILPQPVGASRITCDRSRHRARDDRAARTGASTHSMALRKPAESRSPRAAGSYDIAFVLEVLQYVPLAEALGALWERLLPGGRIVGVVPNADCPIVSRTRARFGAKYAPPTLHQIDAVLQGCDELEHAAYRGLAFGGDQRLAPYEVSSWRTLPTWESEPNRIQFVAIKRSARSA